MDLEDAVGFIGYLMEKRREDRIYFRWVIGGDDRVMSFDEFRAMLRPKRTRSDEEILEEVYAVFEKAGIK